jgi:hypothetical protein
MDQALTAFVKQADSYKIPFQVKHLEWEDRSGYIKNRDGESVGLSPEEEEKLRALGYVD